MTAKRTSINKWWKTDGVLGEFFRTKAELEARIRGIVAKYPLEAEMSAGDAEFLTAIFERHFDWENKKCCGVRGYFTRTVPAWSGPTTGIWIKRTDGTEVDISWVVALMPGGAPSSVLNATAAARFEVVDQRNAASNAVAWGAPCPVCGEPLTDGRHVDHKPPKTFKALFDGWLASTGLSYEDVKTEEVGAADNQFVDRELAASWAAFHRENAELRVIHKHENLARVA